MAHVFNLMPQHLHTSSHLSYFSSVHKDDAMSKRNAEPITESATARQRPVRNLSAYVEVEKNHEADYVVGVEHAFHMMKAGSNNQRQQSKTGKLCCEQGRGNLGKHCREQHHATAKQAESATHKY